MMIQVEQLYYGSFIGGNEIKNENSAFFQFVYARAHLIGEHVDLFFIL